MAQAKKARKAAKPRRRRARAASKKQASDVTYELVKERARSGKLKVLTDQQGGA